MPRSSFSTALNKLIGLDIYGHPVGVHMGGKGSYQTKFGAFCTIVTFVLALINTLKIGGAYLNKTDQTEFF